MKTYECRFTHALRGAAEVVLIQADDDLHACAKADALLIEQARYESVDLYGVDRCIVRLRRDPPGRI
jgi:hypothetical protein